MNVPNIGQGLGSVTALPRTAGDGDTTPPRAESVASERRSGERRSGETPRVGVDVARLAWFDVNGDGHIDPRSTASGGDATLLVPAHADLPTYSRNVSRAGAATSDKADAPGNPAQTNRAVDAYQRYGQVSVATPPPESAPAPAVLTAERAVA